MQLFTSLLMNEVGLSGEGVVALHKVLFLAASHLSVTGLMDLSIKSGTCTKVATASKVCPRILLLDRPADGQEEYYSWHLLKATGAE